MFNYHKSHTEKMKEYSVKHKTIHTFITCHYCQRNIDFLNDPAQNYIYGKEQYSSPHTKVQKGLEMKKSYIFRIKSVHKW